MALFALVALPKNPVLSDARLFHPDSLSQFLKNTFVADELSGHRVRFVILEIDKPTRENER